MATGNAGSDDLLLSTKDTVAQPSAPSNQPDLSAYEPVVPSSKGAAYSTADSPGYDTDLGGAMGGDRHAGDNANPEKLQQATGLDTVPKPGAEANTMLSQVTTAQVNTEGPSVVKKVGENYHEITNDGTTVHGPDGSTKFIPNSSNGAEGNPTNQRDATPSKSPDTNTGGDNGERAASDTAATRNTEAQVASRQNEVPQGSPASTEKMSAPTHTEQQPVDTRSSTGTSKVSDTPQETPRGDDNALRSSTPADTAARTGTTGDTGAVRSATPGDTGTKSGTTADTGSVSRNPQSMDSPSSTRTGTDQVPSANPVRTGTDQVQSANSLSNVDQSRGEVKQTSTPEQIQSAPGRTTVADSPGSVPSKGQVDSTQKVGDSPIQRPTEGTVTPPRVEGATGVKGDSATLGGGSLSPTDKGPVRNTEVPVQTPTNTIKSPESGIEGGRGSIDGGGRGAPTDGGKGNPIDSGKGTPVEGGNKGPDVSSGTGRTGQPDVTTGQGVKGQQTGQPTDITSQSGTPSKGTGSDVNVGQGGTRTTPTDVGGERPIDKGVDRGGEKVPDRGGERGPTEVRGDQGGKTGPTDVTSGQTGTGRGTPTDTTTGGPGKSGQTDSTSGQTGTGRGTSVDSVGTAQPAGVRSGTTDITGTPGKDSGAVGGDRGTDRGGEIGRGTDGATGGGKDRPPIGDSRGDTPVVTSTGGQRQPGPVDKGTDSASGSLGGGKGNQGDGPGKGGDGTPGRPTDAAPGRPSDSAPGKTADTGGGKTADTGGGKTADTGGGKSADTAPGKTADTGGGKTGGDQPTVPGKGQDVPVVKVGDAKPPETTKTDKPEGGISQSGGDSKLESRGDAGKADPGASGKGQPTDAARPGGQPVDTAGNKGQPTDATAGRASAEYYKQVGDGQYVSGKTVRDALTNAGVDFNSKDSRMQMLDVINKMQSGKLDQLDANGLKISQALSQLDGNRLARIQSWLTAEQNGLLGKNATGANLASLFDGSQRFLERLAGKDGQAALGELGRMMKDVTNATGGDITRELTLRNFLSRQPGDHAELNVQGLRLMPGQEAALRNLQEKIDAFRASRAEREVGEKVEGTFVRGGKFEARGETFGTGGKVPGRQDQGARVDGSVRGADISRKDDDRDANGNFIGRTDVKDKFGDEREEEKQRKRREEEKEKDKERDAEAKRLSEAALAALAARKIKEEQERAEKEKAQEKDKKDKEKRQKYTVKEKDTLESIALAQLKDKRLAPLILEINKNLIPTRKEKGKTIVSLHPKMVIWLPTTTDIQSFRARGMGAAVPQYLYDDKKYESAEAELEARYGERFDKVEDSQQSASAQDDQSDKIAVADPGAPDEGTQTRRQNIERLLGPLASKPETDQIGRLKYQVRLGDTLKSVAVRHPALGDVALWKLLAEVNKMPVDDKSSGGLKRGSQIFIPTAQEVEEYRIKHSLKTPAPAAAKPATKPAKTPQIPQAEIVTKPCPGCGRLATLTADICPACGNPFIESMPAAEQRDFSPESAGGPLNFAVPEDDVTKSLLSAFGWSGNQKPASDKKPSAASTPDETKLQSPAAEPPKESTKRGGLPIIKRVPAQQSDDSHTAPLKRMPSGMPMARKGEPQPVPASESSDLPADATIQLFSEEARLVKAPASPDGGFKTRLEVRHQGKWAIIVLYEIYDDVSLRHEYTLNGQRKTFRIDLPPQAAQELAENDVNSNWQNYCTRFLAGKDIRD